MRFEHIVFYIGSLRVKLHHFGMPRGAKNEFVPP